MRVTDVEQFSNTVHVETVVLMSRKDKLVPESGVFPGFYCKDAANGKPAAG